jgi:TonB family protein
MKNLLSIAIVVSLLLAVGVGCKSNPFSSYLKSDCELPGVPSPKTAEEYVTRATAHLEKANYSAEYNRCAYQDFDEAVLLDPDNSTALTGRGMMLLRTNMQTKGLADLDQAIVIDSKNISALTCRGEFFADKGDYDKAIADMTSVLALHNLDSYHAKRAALYEKKGDLENAVKDYSDAIDLKEDGVVSGNTGTSSYYVLRAGIYRKQGKSDLADADESTSKEIFTKPSDYDKGLRTGDSRTIAGGSLNEKAISLPQPGYPATARAVKAGGKVVVNIEVAPDGSVVKAEAVSGHPLLKSAAAQAAKQAKFKPGTAPVSGSLEYVFNSQ